MKQDEVMHIRQKERSEKFKQPSSMTLEMEEKARKRFASNLIKGHKSIKQKEIIDLINVGVDGLINNGIY